MSGTDLEIGTLAGSDPHDYLAYDGAGAADVSDRFDRYLAAGSAAPVALDHFDLRPGVPDAVEVGAALLRSVYAAHEPAGSRPDLHLFLPPRWRETTEAAAISTRIAAAELAGLTVLVERHRVEYVAGTPLADDEPRLTLAATPADDDPLIDLLRRISTGSLDAGTLRTVAEVGPEEAARRYLADMDALPGSRDGWLVALDGGTPVGLAVATAETAPYPLVAFVGVDPDHRGKAVGLALLVEATRRLTAAGADRVRADTDVTNEPMVAVFARAGWRPWATRLVLQPT